MIQTHTSDNTENSAPSDSTAASTFRQLVANPSVLAALERLGISTPTPVQAASLPLSLAGRDLIVQAKTGSGKTIAFAIPLIAALEANPGRRGTLALVLTPTRELANQITSVIGQLAPDVRPVCLIGGISIREQLKQLEQDRRVVVGTPGRVLDLIRQRELILRTVRFFTVDEVDEMFSMDFEQDVRGILEKVPDERQGMFVSATVTPRVEMLARSFLKSPERIVIDTPGEERAPIEHRVCNVGGDMTDKVTALCDLIEVLNPRSAIVFCNTKSDTELVEVYLRRRGFDARLINSDLNQRQRDAIVNQVREEKLRFLIATDIAARGLDIDHIDIVFNYSIPMETDLYVHRTGRTGRAGRSGIAINLVGPQDFSTFLSLKRSGQFEFVDQAVPGSEEIVGARVAHIQKVARELSEGEPQPRDRATASALLSSVGGISEPNSELVDLTARLCRAALEQHALLMKRTSESRSEPGGDAQEEESRPARREQREHRRDRGSSRGSRGRRRRDR